jgi:hypothetical protein
MRFSCRHGLRNPVNSTTASAPMVEEIEAAGRDVLAHLSGGDAETGGAELVVQFGVKQVDLTQVGLLRIAGHPRAVLDRRAGVRIALDAEPGQ